MIDSLYRLLEPTKTIEDAMTRIKEAFISFYGEQEREFIENRFDNTVIIGYQTPENMGRIINDIKKEYDKQLQELFFKEINLPNTEENLNGLLMYGSFEDYSYAPLRQYEKAVAYFKMSKEERILEEKKQFVNFIQRFIPNLTMENFEKLKNDKKVQKAYSIVCKTDISYEEYFIKEAQNTEEIISKRAFEVLKKIYPDLQKEEIEEKIKNNEFTKADEILKSYIKCVDKKQEMCQTLKKYEDYVKSCEELKNKLDNKYYTMLCDEFSYLFTKEQLESELNAQNLYRECFGYRIDSPLPIKCFSKESESYLHEEGWRKESVIHDRIAFYNAMGIHLGTNYEDYANNTECKKITPSFELVESIEKRHEVLQNQYTEEYYSNIGEYKMNRAKIDAQKLVNEDEYTAKQYMDNVTFITPNAKEIEGQLEPAPIMCINLDTDLSYLDARVIHELHHVYEVSITGKTDKGISYVSGWDTLDNVPYKGNKEESESNSKRKYELFSEIVNELLSQKITEILHTNNGHIFSPANKAKIAGGTSYEETNFLIRPLLEKYSQEIIASRKNNNLAVLFEKIGKENFEKYNSLFSKFRTHFSGFGFYQVMTEREKGLNTENTQILNEIIHERDQILTQMEQYSNSYKNSI